MDFLIGASWMICELKTQLLKYIAMLFIENNYLCKQTYQSFIMDTISVGINQTGNEQFVTWIIIAVVFISVSYTHLDVYKRQD